MSKEQIQSLLSPVRAALLTAYVAYGPASVPEIAGLLGHSTKSLYYQVKILVSLGLLRQVGTREKVRHVETMYDAVADRHFAKHGEDPDLNELLARSVASGLNAAAKEYELLSASPTIPEATEFWRTRVRLPDDKAKRLKGMLQEALEFARKHDTRSGSDSYTITIALIPILKSLPEEES